MHEIRNYLRFATCESLLVNLIMVYVRIILLLLHVGETFHAKIVLQMNQD